MKQLLTALSFDLPYDIAFQIASSLEVRDVCALGSCSKFWRNLCQSDLIWVSLTSKRWPSLRFSHHFSMGWKAFYIERHHEMESRIVKFMERSSFSVSLEVRDYLKAIEELCSMQIEFVDVQMFLLKPELNVLLNLVGLHYSINWLGVPLKDVMEALEGSHVSDKQISVKWWKVGQWSHGFRLRDEVHYRVVSLTDLATSKQEDILGVLCRGAVYEVIRVQISVAHPLSVPWTCQSSALPGSEV